MQWVLKAPFKGNFTHSVAGAMMSPSSQGQEKSTSLFPLPTSTSPFLSRQLRFLISQRLRADPTAPLEREVGDREYGVGILKSATSREERPLLLPPHNPLPFHIPIVGKEEGVVLPLLCSFSLLSIFLPLGFLPMAFLIPETAEIRSGVESKVAGGPNTHPPTPFPFLFPSSYPTYPSLILPLRTR